MCKGGMAAWMRYPGNRLAFGSVSVGRGGYDLAALHFGVGLAKDLTREWMNSSIGVLELQEYKKRERTFTGHIWFDRDRIWYAIALPQLSLA
jgi:hypothetical protein